MIDPGKLSALDFVSGFIKTTGLFVRGSLYIFYRTDLNKDNMVIAEELKAAFDEQDLNGKFLQSMIKIFFCLFYFNLQKS